MRPIREDIHIAVAYDEPEKFTIREAIEWWKRCVRASENLGQATSMEIRYMNERWVGLVAAIAEREGVPTGSLSYFMGELATAEMRALHLAKEAAEELPRQLQIDV